MATLTNFRIVSELANESECPQSEENKNPIQQEAANQHESSATSHTKINHHHITSYKINNNSTSQGANHNHNNKQQLAPKFVPSANDFSAKNQLASDKSHPELVPSVVFNKSPEKAPAIHNLQNSQSVKLSPTSKQHFQIRWTNLTYQVEPRWYRQNVGSMLRGQTSKGRTKILTNLNGTVNSGQVTAILGPSGAGKTSLLGCLTGKHKSGVSGCVQVISERSEPMSICTIPQKDYLLNQLTVRENLWYASRLKHPEDQFDHDSNIERVLELLKLESCIDTQISKISGGQHKRVSIAQELLSNPDILILDEPTSGLDSLTCYKTVMVLRDLARLSPNPMAILVTIHQPQREVFDLFNHVYILATGGRCIYEGNPTKCINTINEFGGGLQFDAHQYNPASYLVEIASVEFGEKPIESLMEHQQREFRRRTREDESAAGNGCYYDEITGKLLSATPNLKKRQSPMVARFKSTLNNLTRGGGRRAPFSDLGGFASPKLGPKNMIVMDQSGAGGGVAPVAFANEAFEHYQSQTSLDQQQQQQLNTTPNYNNSNHHNHQSSLASHQQNTNSKQQTAAAAAPSDNNNDNIDSNIKTISGSLSASSNNNIENGAKPIPAYEERLVIASSNGEPIEDGEFYLDDRLQTHKHNHKGHFLRHCSLLTKRSWLCLCKDPMLTTLRFSAHIIVPLLITLVYGSRVGKPNACPIYETEMDLIDYARNGPKRLMQLQSELRCTFENVGLYFLSIYAFTFSTMCLTSLSFPLNMHVLLKEVRNGWYSLPTYFIGKTLADFPLEFILPVVTLIITYPLTGQPDSYLEWRFIAATSVFVITSLIAQTQGLIFGALFMNAMQAAVFVAPVSTTPLILLSGFLIRISQMPSYLQTLSAFSYFRYAIESLTIIRYGFKQCPCDPQLVTGKPVTPAGVPDQLRTMTNYWLSTFDSPDSSGSFNETDLSNELVPTTTLIPPSADGQPVDFFQDLTVLLARANSFGTEIKTCDELKPYPMIDFNLTDDMLGTWAMALVATLIMSKIVNYLVVKYSVKWRL